jgi:hypothetical protein
VQSQFGAATGYMAVYAVEVVLLCATLAAMLPMLRRTAAARGAPRLPGLAAQ